MNNTTTIWNETIMVRENFNKMDPGQQFSLVSNYCMCFIAFATAIALSKLLYTVVQKLGKSEFVIPSMILSLVLASVSLVLFFMMQVNVSSKRK